MCILKGRGDERTLLFFMVVYGDCKKILSGIRFEQVVVSMRPIPHKDVVRAVQVTSRFPSVHGAPIHIGDPKLIGIHDIYKPDFGDPVTIREEETPVFWACGVTPPSGCYGSKAGYHDYACPRTYVYYRSAR